MDLEDDNYNVKSIIS